MILVYIVKDLHINCAVVRDHDAVRVELYVVFTIFICVGTCHTVYGLIITLLTQTSSRGDHGWRLEMTAKCNKMGGMMAQCKSLIGTQKMIKDKPLDPREKKQLNTALPLKPLSRSTSKAHLAAMIAKKERKRNKCKRTKKKKSHSNATSFTGGGIVSKKPKPSPVFRVCLRVLPSCPHSPFSFISFQNYAHSLSSA